MKVNTHGRKITGLKAASGYTTEEYQGYYEIWYDSAAGEVWTKYHHNWNEWTEYHNPQIVCVARCNQHLTMQQIADCIDNYYTGRENWQ